MSIVTHLWTYLSLFVVVFGVERPFWMLNGTLMLNGILVLNGLLAAGQASRSRRPPGVLRRVRAFPRLAVQAVILENLLFYLFWGGTWRLGELAL